MQLLSALHDPESVLLDGQTGAEEALCWGPRVTQEQWPQTALSSEPHPTLHLRNRFLTRGSWMAAEAFPTLALQLQCLYDVP